MATIRCVKLPEFEKPKQGTCKWCERHNQTLYLTIGIDYSEMWTEWLCAKCRSIANPFHKWLNEMDENGIPKGGADNAG